jgi:HEAT repeat protein
MLDPAPMKRFAVSLLALALWAAPRADAQAGPAGAAGQTPGTGPVGGPGNPPVGQLPLKPRGPPKGGYTGPGDTPPVVTPPDGPPSGGPGTPPSDPIDEPPSTSGGGGVEGPPLGGVPPVGPVPPTTDPGLLGFDLTEWTWWWELNKEPYLVLSETGGPMRPVTHGGEPYLGPGEPFDRPGGRPSDAVLDEVVVPALLRTLERERSSDILAASAIALGRLGSARPPAKQALYATALRKLLVDGDPAVGEAATLALGILGDDASAPLLADLLLGTRDGRDALSESRVPVRLRSFAAYALGLLGHATDNEDVRRYAVHQLVWCLATDRSESTDLAAACVNALGAIPVVDPRPSALQQEPAPPGSSLTAEVDYLLALLGEHRRDSRVRAQVPIALGRLLSSTEDPSREVLRQRVAMVLFDLIAAHRREPREVVQSCVTALGQIGDNDADELDRRIRRTLLRIEDLVNDVPARQYALIALGRACGRAGPGEPDSLRDERTYLQHELSRGGTLMRSWAALALGLAERGAVDDDDKRRALFVALDEARVDREVGAYSIAVGLAREAGAAPALLGHLDDHGDEATLGHVALGLGLAGSAAGEQALFELLPAARFRPALLHDAALGLELLGADRVVGALVDLLGSSGSVASQGAIGLALARSKDDRAVAPLIALLDDGDATALVRAYAAAALGGLGDRNAVHWKALYSVDANLHAAPETLFALAGGGVLNLF